MSMNYLRRILPVVAAVCFWAGQTAAQQIKLMRFDEDYSQLRDSSRNFYHTLKFLPITKNKQSYLTFGGEARIEFGGKINEDWLPGQGFNPSFLQRYSFFADVNLSKKMRLFAQLNSGLENGSKYGPSPVDEDQLAVQNLFLEYRLLQDSLTRLSVRIGRQEINYGSGRLISVREGTTVRQYFTGGKLSYSKKRFSADAFVLAADEVDFGVFDNRLLHEPNLWGIYSNLIVLGSGNFDFYYLGINRKQARYEEGTGKEVRHTVATRYWRSGGGFNYNIEAAYQFGRFGQGNISAWTTAIELGYKFESLKYSPSINLRNDYISGDGKPGDGRLQTFNPLYPKGGYFGFNPMIGPANLVDLHPYITMTLSPKLGLQADVVFNWRYSLNDGIYRPSGNFNKGGSHSSNRYIGTTYLLSADYSFSQRLTLSCGAQYFKVGAFINDLTPNASDSKFFNMQLGFKF